MGKCALSLALSSRIHPVVQVWQGVVKDANLTLRQKSSTSTLLWFPGYSAHDEYFHVFSKIERGASKLGQLSSSGYATSRYLGSFFDKYSRDKQDKVPLYCSLRICFLQYSRSNQPFTLRTVVRADYYRCLNWFLTAMSSVWGLYKLSSACRLSVAFTELWLLSICHSTCQLLSLSHLCCCSILYM